MALLTRVAVAMLSLILIKILRTNDHLSVEVALTGTMLLWGWLGIWVGAWLQFMYGNSKR